MKNLSFVLICLIVVLSCTPKATDEAQSSTANTPPPLPTTSDDPCATFSDSRAGEAAMDAHVIYRDYVRAKDYDQAKPYWEEAFAVAPAADGQRQTHYEDGIAIYEHYLGLAEDEGQKRFYLDSIFDLYDRMGECYHPGDVGYIEGRKAWDLYYKHRDFVGNQEIYNHFTSSLDTDGMDAEAFVINPFTALLVEMYQGKQISQQEAVDYAQRILDICENNINNEEDGWPVVNGYAPARLEAFETVRGFYDCAYFTDKYLAPVDLANADCEELFLLGTRLKYGGCDVNGEALRSVAAAYSGQCRVSTPDPLLAKARTALEEDRYSDAILAYEEYLETRDDPERLAQFNLRIAKIYYAHVRNFPKAREYAYKALEYRSDWGEPYLLIGKLYASSGPLCGPGRGWDSQIVTWPAIDKFVRARQVDPSVAREANNLISRYQKYMPSVEDIFQRQLNEGDRFTVPCWIQETTSIRAAKS